ncbi:MAG: DNA mismatch repair endonuclease MutL, partial [Gammaproteobacteria bacterium]|nr:DNA mismatch repair endonuclease MutL [Gammaproteobacteria bacterium]
MRIQTLSPHVANQIAAGEVIERPASVVKELLENALDAGAKNIDIQIGFGGLNQIKISDDGDGILSEDLPLAIAAHATSKLKVLDDLYLIQSMGFRGEALASICAVSRVFIQSREPTEAHGMCLESDEQGIRLLPCARNKGTSIEVQDLFFNAPVRKKFLKSAAQEYQAIEALVKRIAFTRPAVALTLSHNAKLCLQLPAAPSERAQRVRLTKLLGKAFVDDAVFIDVTRGQMRLHGWVSGPGYARSQQDKLWVYINQRVVRDKLIMHALRQAYADILPEGRYPACVLFLSLPLDEIDINVHPSKYEVRFSDARAVHDLIRLAIIEMRSTRSLVAEVSPSIASNHALSEDDSQAADLNAQSDIEYYSKKSWVVLNTTFAVLIHERLSYLIHVERLHQSARLSELSQAPYPWEARPLLVPVVLDVPEDGLSKLAAHQSILEKFGFIFEVRQHNAVRISAIPKVLPGLDLNCFLKLFFAVELDALDLNERVWLQLLIESELVNAMAMTEDEQCGL